MTTTGSWGLTARPRPSPAWWPSPPRPPSPRASTTAWPPPPDLGYGARRAGKPVDRARGPSEPATGSADVEPAGRGPHNADMYEHRGNGEHPQSLERRRQLLVWRSLAVLIALVVGWVCSDSCSNW
jgi:hypothetical protein